MKDNESLFHIQDTMNRRTFLLRTGAGMGAAALSLLMADPARAQPAPVPLKPMGMGLPDMPNFAPKAKRVIYLFQGGGPSQLEMFDYKPMLLEQRGKNLPDSVRMGQRLTGMTANQKTFPVAPAAFKFAQYGQSGAWISELLPYTGKIADDICIIKSTTTDAINHDPAVTFVQSGSQIAGRPTVGSWLSYGLGSENRDLPAYIVLISMGKGHVQPIADRNWGSGFLPTEHQGVRFHASGEPVLYLNNPHGLDRDMRRQMLDEVEKLNRMNHALVGDPEIMTRITQYEMAYRMQASVPDLADLSKEPPEILDMYGPDARKPGTFAANCLLARRLAERGVRFVQLFHLGWDQHGDLPKQIRDQCTETDQPSAALISDLKQRGLLDDTLVVWGGEFGRTVYSQGVLTADNYGRDHHPRCFTTWMAGGGIRGGTVIGETDDFSYNVIRDPVNIHDLHATMLYLLGIDHERLTYKFQGRFFRLTDVSGNVVRAALA